MKNKLDLDSRCNFLQYRNFEALCEIIVVMFLAVEFLAGFPSDLLSPSMQQRCEVETFGIAVVLDFLLFIFVFFVQ